MVNHLSFQDDTTEANKPAKKTRFKKYTKTRRKKVENAPSPKRTWWKKNSLYQLLCCQNTCYSVALYLALVLFIALFVYAVWKICDLRFASKSHHGSKRPLDNKDHTSKSGDATSTGQLGRHHLDANTVNSLKTLHQRPVSTTRKPVTRYSESRTFGTTTNSYNAISGRAEQNRKTSETASMSHLNKWQLDSPYQTYLQGDKRYMIPPSPAHLNYFRPFDGSGGSTVEEWRAMRLALLRKRLKLTTGSSYPTDNPYWKTVLAPKLTPGSSFFNPYFTDRRQTDNSISPVHDDSMPNAIPLATYSKTPTVKVSPNIANTVSKHSEIQGIDANSTFGKGYTKLLADLFSKMIALRNTKNTTTATGPSSFSDSYAKGTYSIPAALNIPSNKYNASSPGIGNISDKNTGKKLQTANSLAGNKQSTNYSTLLNLTTTSRPVTTTVTARATETTKSAFSVQGTPPQKSAQSSKNLSSDIDHNLALHRSKLRMPHKNPRYHLKLTRKETAEASSIQGHKKHHSKVKTVKHNKMKKEKRHKLKNSGRPSKHRKSHRRGKVFEEKSVESSYNKADELLGSGSGSIDYTASGSGIGSGIGMDSSSIISSGSGLYAIDHSLSSGWSSGDGHHNEGEYGRNKVTHTNRHTSKKAGAKKSYVGLRKTLIKLKKKHTKSKKVHSSKSEHHKKEKLHGTKSSRHHKLHKSLHHDKERNVKKNSKHRSHKEKTFQNKEKKHSKHVESKKKHSNKHKYMKIIQQKLMRVKKKHQIARHLSKVQKKLEELEKRKKSKQHHKKHRTKASEKSKSLEMPARKQEIPKHWKMGVVKMKECSILKQFDKRHYVGINLYKKEHNKYVYAVTDCTLKKGFHHRYKCRRLFYKTTGYMMLKRNAIRSSEINLVFCRHKSSFNRIAERNVKNIKKATITPKKRNEDTDDDDDDDDGDNDDHDDDDDDEDKTARKRSSISKDKSVSHSKHNHEKSQIDSNKHSKGSNSKHRKSSKRDHTRHHKKAKREHTKKHTKHNHHHHRRSRHSSKKNKHLHDDNEEIIDSGDESGSGDHGSGDVEERFERSATSHYKGGGKKTGKKKKHAKSNHERKKGQKHVSAETTMYAKFFDMMKEMKQEIQNVTSVNVHSSNNATSIINKLNASKALEAESNSSVSAKQKNETKSDRQPTHKAQTTVHSTTSTTKSANGTKTASIQDMVAQIVPAIMKQFQSKDIMKANSISNDKKLMTQSTLATTSSTTIRPKPTTKSTTVKTTAITTTKRPPTTAIRKARTQVHTPTKRVASHHTSVRHTTPHHHSTNHHTTKHVSKPKAKTTQAPNIALILKGLKALGISPITKHTPTKSPSIQQRSVIPSLARLKTPIKPKSPTRNTPTKQQPLPAPIPKPLALHNPYQMHLLCFGDSLTAGYHNHGKAFSPYGNHLRQLINLSSKIPTTVEIKGIVGEMTHKQMAARLPEVLGNSSVFDWVIILGGTNDILHVKNFADDQEFLGQLENVWQPRITKDIEKLHDISHKYGAHSMLLTVPENAIESWPGYKILLNMRKKINNALRQYAAQHRDKVALCDIAQKLPRHSLTQQQETAFWDDHLHMTERGYSRMAEEVFKCLKAYIPKR